jgi:hypothetical protein
MLAVTDVTGTLPQTQMFKNWLKIYQINKLYKIPVTNRSCHGPVTIVCPFGFCYTVLKNLWTMYLMPLFWFVEECDFIILGKVSNVSNSNNNNTNMSGPRNSNNNHGSTSDLSRNGLGGLFAGGMPKLKPTGRGYSKYLNM